MQQIHHHTHLAPHSLLRESDQYMPGHGLGSHAGDDTQAEHTVDMFRIAFWFSLLLTLPVILWEPRFQAFLGYRLTDFIGINLTPALFATAVFYYGGQIFIRTAYREIRDHQPGMMVLISLAISTAFIYSVMVTFGFAGQPMWWQLALLITLLLLGNWLDMRSITRADHALQELGELLPATTLRLTASEQLEKITLRELRAGQLLLIQPGDKFPADGIVMHGSSDVDESMLTGAIETVTKQEGDSVLAGTLNGTTALRVQVTAAGEKSVLARNMQLVEHVLNTRTRMQAHTDRAAYFLTMIAIASAGLTLLVWLLMGASLEFTLARTISVLIIAAPQAIGLSLPLVFAMAITRGVRQGLLVKDRRALEDARNINVVIFDEGTLTAGELRVLETVTSGELAAPQALHLAAAVERSSHQKLAELIRTRGSSTKQRDDSLGIQASIDGCNLSLGGDALLQSEHIVLPEKLMQAAQRYRENGQLPGYLLEDRQALAVFAVADPVRYESHEAIDQLHQLGVEVALFSQDSKGQTDLLAQRLGIDIVYPQIPPEQKAEKICHLQEQGKCVAIVGTGNCDAAAMMAADVGFAFGVGNNIEESRGDIAQIRSDPRDIARIIKLSQAAHRKMIENLWWAGGYNLLALPMAAGLFVTSGLLPSPILAAILMAVSTAIVALNTQQLRELKL